jgi:hypothetical protein
LLLWQSQELTTPSKFEAHDSRKPLSNQKSFKIIMRFKFSSLSAKTNTKL